MLPHRKLRRLASEWRWPLNRRAGVTSCSGIDLSILAAMVGTRRLYERNCRGPDPVL
jgi:hypothetical protein